MRKVLALVVGLLMMSVSTAQSDWKESLYGGLAAYYSFDDPNDDDFVKSLFC